MDTNKIVYIKDEEYYLYDGKTLTIADIGDAKKYHVTSSVNPSALYLHAHKLPSSLDDNLVGIKMDISMYDEGGASEDKDYITSFIRTPLKNEDNDFIDLFGITTEQANSLYKDAVQELKAIDIITPSILAYHSLYENEPENTTDVYLYFGDEEAYGVVYANGKYISYRSTENLARISALCGWELDTLKAALKTRGIQGEAYNQDEIVAYDAIRNSIYRSVEKIIHTLNHKKGLFNMPETTRVFIDFDGDEIPGLKDAFEYYSLEISSLKPIRVENNDRTLTHDVIIANYILGVVNGKYETINISPFEREEPVYKKPIANLFLSALFGALIVSSIVFTLSMLTDANNKEIDNLNANIASANGSSKKTVSTLKSLQVKKDNLEKYYLALQDQDGKLKKSKRVLPGISSQATQRQQMIDNALEGLSKNHLGAEFMEQNGSNHLTIGIVTEVGNEEKIANFLNFMTNYGYKKSSTDKIESDNGTYRSVVEIEK